MKEYHKIPSVYERDPKTKKLKVGAFTNPEAAFLQDAVWEFSEKFDGANVRVHWDGHEVTFGGRTDKAQLPAPLMNKLIKLFGGETNAQIFEQKFGATEVTLYGEGYGGNIQGDKNRNYGEETNFILFDAEVAGNFQPRESVERLAEYFGIETVPIFFTGTLLEGIDLTLRKQSSELGEEIGFEGAVARPQVEMRDRTGKRIIVKIKQRDFEERSK